MLNVAIFSMKAFNYAILLIIIACVPATVQLACDGFAAPVAIPFGISIEEALADTSGVVWVDARPEDLYKMGHIPGALNLNRTNWNKTLSQLFESYAPGRKIIVYCSAGCSESEEVANQIRNLGLDPVLVLEGGFDAWQKSKSGS